jgi:hypothetical protein
MKGEGGWEIGGWLVGGDVEGGRKRVDRQSEKIK